MPRPIEALPEAQPPDEHNRRLVDHVHPRDWENPEPRPRYDLAVVGAGPAGLVAAMGAAGLGARVALIERNLLGGDCLNTGCVPSKALIRAARAAVAVGEAAEFGLHIVPRALSFNFGAMMERMRRLRADLGAHDSARRCRDQGVDVFIGEASFTGPATLQVEGRTVAFSKACIATGTRAAFPEIPGLKEAGALTNETVFTLTKQPERLAVIGAGPIGVEMAQTFARFGSQITLIEGLPGILARDDREAAALVERSLREHNLELLCGHEVTRISRTTGSQAVEVRAKENGLERTVYVDRILVAAGRAPNVAGLGLAAAGVEFDPRTGITVDDRLRTSNRRIYAAGDICSQYKFTHMADAMARIVIANALFLGRAKVSRLIVPWCTYTDPELAQVGLSEHEAEAQGVAIDTFRTELAEVDRAVLDGETEGFVKIHCKRGTDSILGATIVARHAGEMLSEITTAMQAGVGLRSLARTIHPYPTRSEAVRKTADAYQRARLTPRARRLLRAILRWSA